jgi:hypothetical protein
MDLPTIMQKRGQGLTGDSSSWKRMGGLPPLARASSVSAAARLPPALSPATASVSGSLPSSRALACTCSHAHQHPLSLAANSTLPSLVLHGIHPTQAQIALCSAAVPV